MKGLFVALMFASVACTGQVLTGAQQLDLLLPKLKGHRVALVVNQTSLVGRTHVADTLHNLGVNITKIFAPEHGFRGDAADGEIIKDGVDQKTGIPIVSIYGKDKKPTTAQLNDVDIVIFDIQDVGTRFYTYISTMHYVMEACAESNKKIIILDRPDPNGYVDGPVMQDALKSFVGMHNIPIAHGMTIGEMARMINGEGWLDKGIHCELDVIPLKGWTHADAWHIVVRPSPNLPNDQAIALYPSICLFEGTVISVGRGTDAAFQVLGNPLLTNMPYQFTPVSIPGVSVDPPHKNVKCFGLDLRNAKVQRRIDLSYLIDLYHRYPEKDKFFTSYFDKLAGTPILKQQIRDGMTEDAIRKSWQKDLDAYQLIRKKYLLYP